MRIRGLHKTYLSARRGPVLALSEVTFDVEPGEFVTVVGPSGCGKSTLLKIIAGLIEPTAGDVLLQGRSLRAPSRDIGIVFQDPVLLPWRSVLENVLLPAEILGLDLKSQRTAARRLLDLFGLGPSADQAPGELSGGMRQRASICRALLSDPTVLLMDEPFGALDALTREDAAFELLKVWTGRRKTVVFVTHSIAEAVTLGDRVVVLTGRPGRVAAVVKPLLSRPRTPDMQTLPEFQDACGEIRRLICANRGTTAP